MEQSGVLKVISIRLFSGLAHSDERAIESAKIVIWSDSEMSRFVLTIVFKNLSITIDTAPQHHIEWQAPNSKVSKSKESRRL